MLEKTLKIFMVLQIILIALAATDEKHIAEVGSNTNAEEEVIANEQKLNAALDKNKQFNGDGGKNLQLNSADGEHVQLKENEPYGNIQELKKQLIPKSQKGREENEKNKKFSSWKFKYAENKKDEPGFDLTPEEMKTFKIWKDGVIPYYIDVISFSDKVLRDKIRNFLQMVNSATSINFVEIPGPPSDDYERWVFFMNRRGLLSCADHSVENLTNQGVQQVVLGYDCIATRGEIAEAVMSIVGVPAQHNAPDRDKYIKVNMENVMADKKNLFEKLNDNEWLFHDLAYDFDSVTHYDIHKHSANGHATIEIKKNRKDFIPATIFSATDLQKIKMLYNFIARNKKMETPVCKKLFKMSSKFNLDPSMSIGLEPRKKPNRYSGIEGKNEPIEEHNEGNNSKEEIYNKTDYEVGTDFGDDDNETIEDEKQYNDKKADGNIDAKNRPKKTLKDRGKAAKVFKARQKKQPVIDLLQELSDYHSHEDERRALKFGKKQTTSIDLLLALSDYQTDEEGGIM